MPNARATDPQTSWDAAMSISSESISAMKRNVLNLLKNPMTDEELVNLYNNWAYTLGEKFASPSGIRTTRSNLVKAGLVMDTGERVKLQSGRKAIVWKAIA
jgi:hypothetical protein